MPDIKFFTNEPGKSLHDRFLGTLEHAQYFDVLVGYFRTSGFHQLYRQLGQVEKIRILVGLNADRTSAELYETASHSSYLDFESHKSTQAAYSRILENEMARSDDSPEIQLSVEKFIEYIQNDKLEIRAYPSRDIHAKVYITRYGEPVSQVIFGSVITGSSNFSESGLVAQREFNVELKDRPDVEFALEKFESLWDQSVPMSSEFVETIQARTWLNNTITPYELYLKLIYEYLIEDISLQENLDLFLPDNFKDLQYQRQAVTQTRKILERYNGVFLADVVGLGKTFITALLLQQYSAVHKLIICPPVLKDYWEETLRDFGIQRFEVESLGKLEQIKRKGAGKYSIIVIDEAHRFRNENTQSYEYLYEICRQKKVVLVSATPLNNTMDDIFSPIKLFQPPRRSSIPGVANLEDFFGRLRNRLNQYAKTDPNYQIEIKNASNEIRENILKYIMVRRTRSDVTTYFARDLKEQKLSFPEVADPEKFTYIFSGQIEKVFHKTITLLKDFRYARYIALTYQEESQLTAFELQQQRNIGGFMKGLLVKRLESSFFAFRQSIRRFIESYENFLNMLQEGTVYISKKVDVYDLLENDALEQLENMVVKDRVKKYAAENFTPQLAEDLRHDLSVLENIEQLWQNIDEDPKLEAFISQLKTHPIVSKKRLLIFTESRETGDYLYEHLIKIFPQKVMFYSGAGGRHTDKSSRSTHAVARETIKANFDPGVAEARNDIQLLITTDMLAEGVNLHRGNVVINYDLPWNPTRVMQRAGRVNRLGTEHKTVHIYNFFPTTHADKHLGLEANIVAKIQMFHNILGEDSRYLSDGEIVGSQQLFDTLNNRQTYTGEAEAGDSELKYLDMIRTVRDEQPELFEKIKRLPKKARSGMLQSQVSQDHLITFFRQGYLKKFYCNDGDTVREVTFFDAAGLLACKPETPRQAIPRSYFDLLAANKEKLKLDMTGGDEPSPRRGGRSNIGYVLGRLREQQFKQYKGFTETDEVYLDQVRQLLDEGALAKKTAQKIKKDLETEAEPLQVLAVLRRYITEPESFLQRPAEGRLLKREVILSGYLKPV